MVASATQQNAATLRARGASFIGPGRECLPCGYEGIGRLWNVDEIVAKADEILLREQRRSASDPSQVAEKSSENPKKFVDVFF